MNQKPPPFFNAKSPGEVKEKFTKVFWRVGQLIDCQSSVRPKRQHCCSTKHLLAQAFAYLPIPLLAIAQTETPEIAKPRVWKLETPDFHKSPLPLPAPWPFLEARTNGTYAIRRVLAIRRGPVPVTGTSVPLTGPSVRLTGPPLRLQALFYCLIVGHSPGTGL